jgi:hypothetical protein
VGETPQDFTRPHSVITLTLNRLGEREIAAMIDRVTGNKALPKSITQDIIERTDGIPRDQGHGRNYSITVHWRLKCFLQKLTLTRARERIGKKTYIRPTGYASEPFDRAMASARVKGWRIYEVPCGHDVMLDMPERLAAILQETL